MGPKGGHAVKMIGWGVDHNGIDYWICANSWSPLWLVVPATTLLLRVLGPWLAASSIPFALSDR